MRHAMRLLDGGYRLVDLLAQGGVADVYRAIDESTGELVALKILRRRDHQLARRLQREVELLGRLHHPGLVRLVDSGTVEGHGYLVMELLEGGTLEDRLRRGPLPPAEAAEVVSTLAVGLDHVHAAGVVHRDVKPANVLFDRRGAAHLGDFGIAQWVETATLTSNGTTLGTAAYMAPEQLRGGPVGPAADLWALGVVAIESLTGRRLFPGSGVEVVARRLETPVSVPSEIPGPWRRLAEEMVSDRPERRPSAAAARAAGSAFRTAPGPAPVVATVADVAVASTVARGPAPATPWPAVASTAQVPEVVGTVSGRRRARRAVATSAAVTAVLAASAGFAWSYAGEARAPHAPAAYVRSARPAPSTTLLAPTTTTAPPATTTTTAPSPPTTTTAPPPPVRRPAPGPGHGGQGGNH